jgi:hypothetical protein
MHNPELVAAATGNVTSTANSKPIGYKTKEKPPNTTEITANKTCISRNLAT